MAHLENSSNGPPRRIALVDCNNFYASCERVFRPEWNGRPVGVLSNNDGCIIARSNELKDAGIPMGAPFFKYRDQLRKMKAVVVSSNYTLYGDMSARVMSVMGEFTPDIEIYSIDEAWLDLTGFKTDTLDAYARGIVATTTQCTGIPVAMGIAPTKVLAKIANRICKKRKIPGHVYNIGSADNLDAVLASVAVDDVWGIGRQWGIKLRLHGIHTALDLRNANDQEIKKRYNVVMQRIVLELRGIPCLFEDDIQPKKQIIASRSFGARVSDLNSLLQSATMHATRAAEKLRKDGSVCGIMQVFIRSGKHNPKEPFFSRSANIKFPVSTADTRRLIAGACEGVRRIYKPGIRYAKAGVILNDLSPAHMVQGNFFDRPDSERSVALMETLDAINARYGRKTAFFASEGIKHKWAMQRGHMTKHYTTNWNDILVVR